MQLIDEWKTVLHKSWSNRLAAVSAVSGVLQAVVPSLDGLLPPVTFAWLSAVTAALAIFARLIDQGLAVDAPADEKGAA